MLIRKCQRSKWMSRKELTDDEISADALFDVRTSASKLSVWVSDSEANLERIVLALALAGDSIDKIDLMVIDEEDLRQLDLELSASPGRTPLRGVSDLHRDIELLDIDRLAELSRRIATRLRNADEPTHRFAKKRIQRMAVHAMTRGDIDLKEVSEMMLLKLKELTSSP